MAKPPAQKQWGERLPKREIHPRDTKSVSRVWNLPGRRDTEFQPTSISAAIRFQPIPLARRTAILAISRRESASSRRAKSDPRPIVACHLTRAKLFLHSSSRFHQSHCDFQSHAICSRVLNAIPDFSVCGIGKNTESVGIALPELSRGQPRSRWGFWRTAARRPLGATSYRLLFALIGFWRDGIETLGNEPRRLVSIRIKRVRHGLAKLLLRIEIVFA